jgi:hypothetical protein
MEIQEASPTVQCIVSHWSNESRGWSLGIDTTGIIFSYSTTGMNQVDTHANWLPTIDTWYHVAAERDGDDLRFYVDGTQVGTTVDLSGVTISASTIDFTIGTMWDDLYTNFFNGHIDELRLSNGIARWSGNFTPETTAYASSAGYWFIGSTRPLQGVKFYVSTPNNITSTLSAMEWNGTSWTTLTVGDGTASGGISMAQSGLVTFSSTINSSKPKYLGGLSIYWYQFYLSAGSARIYYTTVDAPIQSVKNVWSGEKSYVSKAWKYDGTTFKDYSDQVNDDLTSTSLDVSSLSTAGYVAVGFVEPKQAIELSMVAGSENGTASTTMSAAYGSGSAWTSVTALYDATGTGTTSLSKSGVVSFQPLDPGLEFTRTISDEAPLYYYKLSFAAAPDSDTKIAEIRGITAPPPVSAYRFSETFQDRLFLFNEYSGLKNKAIYSMDRAPDVFNGSDSGELYFGDRTDITAAKSVYNVIGESAQDQLIVSKKNEVYRLTGDSPSTWVIRRISDNIGCVAPLTMTSCEVRGAETTAQKNVIIWQADNGFYMTDGSSVIPISEDIRCYFDPNDSRYIPTSRRSESVAWYDPSIRAYKVLISSGSTATYHNVELEYSLVTGEWTKIYRADGSGADPLQSGFRVFDTNGLSYTYGGNTKGFMYRLENGSTFVDTAIPQYLQTKDIILDKEAPLFRKSTINHIRTAVKKKTNGGSIAVAHYGDQVLTVSGTSNQVGPSSINMATAPYNTQSVALGPYLYHSLKFTASATTVADGMELLGIGLWVQPQTAIR